MSSDRDGEENAALGSDGDPSVGDPTGGVERDADWVDLPDDPDLERHFGYEWIPYEVFGVEENADQLMILPTDEELLKRDAYLAVDPGCIEDLANWQ